MENCRLVFRKMKLRIYIIVATLNLVPRLGNMLGGTPVLISGLCQDPAPGEEVLSRKCVIDGSETPALYVSSTTMLCVTPIMTNPGVVSFEVIMSIKQTSSGELTGRQSNTNFLAGKNKQVL